MPAPFYFKLLFWLGLDRRARCAAKRLGPPRPGPERREGLKKGEGRLSRPRISLTYPHSVVYNLSEILNFPDGTRDKIG